MHSEQVNTFTDLSLPFDIGYHPDLYDEKAGVVREIKPQKWFKEHTEYCVAQLSGYCHFKQATGLFVLYSGKSYSEARMPRVVPWPELRAIALSAYNAMARV